MFFATKTNVQNGPSKANTFFAFMFEEFLY